MVAEIVEYVCSYCGRNGMMNAETECPTCGQAVGIEMALPPKLPEINTIEEYSQTDHTHWACNGMGCQECG